MSSRKGDTGKAQGTLLAGGKQPKIRRAAPCEWTDAKRRQFLDELTMTCNVTASARSVGASKRSAYLQRNRSAKFREQWAKAIAEAHDRLRLMLLERAMNGTVKEVRRANGTVERYREYSDRTALALLKMHAETAARAEEPPLPDEEIDAVRKRIMRKLAVVRKRIEDGEK